MDWYRVVQFNYVVSNASRSQKERKNSRECVHLKTLVPRRSITTKYVSRPLPPTPPPLPPPPPSSLIENEEAKDVKTENVQRTRRTRSSLGNIKWNGTIFMVEYSAWGSGNKICHFESVYPDRTACRFVWIFANDTLKLHLARTSRRTHDERWASNGGTEREINVHKIESWPVFQTVRCMRDFRWLICAAVDHTHSNAMYE